MRKERDQMVRAVDLEKLRDGGTLTPVLQPFLRLAAREQADVVNALGGVDEVTPQQEATAKDYADAGLIKNAEMARYIQCMDPECASRALSAINTRRSLIAVLGLQRKALPVPDLDAYLASHVVHTDAQGPNLAPADQRDVTERSESRGVSPSPEGPAA